MAGDAGNAAGRPPKESLDETLRQAEEASAGASETAEQDADENGD